MQIYPYFDGRFPQQKCNTGVVEKQLLFSRAASSFWVSRFYLDEHRPLHLLPSNRPVFLCITFLSLLLHS
jgi:hypothetical protein